MLVSICVCTYNRAKVLEYCLRSLGNLEAIPSEYELEIVIVDNNSSDETPAVVKRLSSCIKFKVNYFFEGQQGLSVARNRAIDESRGDYLAFLDDECIVPANWLAVAIKNIVQYRPKIMGGPYFGAFLPGQRPHWFKTEYGNAYFLNWRLDRGFQRKFRASGGNMIINRNVFSDLRFDVNLGQKGKGIRLGEDVVLQETFLRANPTQQVFFDPSLFVQHFILSEKMCLSYRFKRLLAHQLGDDPSYTLYESAFAIIRILKLVITVPLKCLVRSRKKYPFWQNYAYEVALPLLASNLVIVIKKLRTLR